MEKEKGNLSVLNVTGGDVTINFSKDDIDQLRKARLMIEDMIRRGYVILLRMEDDTYQRVQSFDPKHDSYIIKVLEARLEGEQETDETSEKSEGTETKSPAKGQRDRKRLATVRVSASESNAVAIAPTAGG